MAGIDLFQQKSWMGGFVQYADRIPPGPRVVGPPPYGIWPVSFERPTVPALVVPEETLCELHRNEAILLARGQATVAAGLGQGGPVAPRPIDDNGQARALIPLVRTDYAAIVGGLLVAGTGLIARMVSQKPTTAMTVASAAAILGGVGLVVKGIQG